VLKIGRDKAGDFDAASSMEWLETNGIGGFASGTVAGVHTRRYHGLLTAALAPPLGRVLLLSKYEDSVTVGGRRFDLSANRYPGTVHPKGHLHLESFRLDPFPTWVYDLDGVRLEHTVFMPHGENSVVCTWRMPDAAGDAVLEIRPLVAFRDYHHLRSADSPFSTAFDAAESAVVSDGARRLRFSHNASSSALTGEWYRHFEYDLEAERGFDFREDLFQPFVLRFPLDGSAVVVASTDTADWKDAALLAAAEKERRASLVEAARPSDGFEEALTLAADQFLVKRGGGTTVIAGYPWFSDWGRDTMIALPGLTLSTGRPELARSILVEFSRHISEGMIPNRFPDEGETPDYNTVDASLWYFEALQAYVDCTDDPTVLDDGLYEKLCDMVSHHLRGTRHGIQVDTDGLLHAGGQGTQLTWMDAKHGDEVFTPRCGKPVEIQALWYNALMVMERFASMRDDAKTAELCRTTAALAKRTFNSVFWNSEDGCLYDVVDGNVRDPSVRPNQIFAVALRHAIVDDSARARGIVRRVERDLLTPFGLRSLAPDDPRYRGVYAGPPRDRDSSYHQGPVWGWLIGPFIDAFVRTFPERRHEVSGMLSGFREHLTAAGVGQISEIFDGNPPHTPRGCPAQAWSVAEVLRVLKRYKGHSRSRP
jgi:predicted glycogen debranching enzyme